MRRGISILVISLFVCGLSTASASAELSVWFTHQYIASGANILGGYRMNYDVAGQSNGAAATCVGVSGYPPLKCGGEGQKVSTGPMAEEGDAVVHNHSTWNSYFNGWLE